MYYYLPGGSCSVCISFRRFETLISIAELEHAENNNVIVIVSVIFIIIVVVAYMYLQSDLI